jgi:hypothetical protein
LVYFGLGVEDWAIEEEAIDDDKIRQRPYVVDSSFEFAVF